MSFLIDHGNLGTRHILGHVVGSAGSLVGVGEADLEDIILPIDNVGGGAGGGQHEVRSSLTTEETAMDAPVVVGPTSICIPQSIRVL